MKDYLYFIKERESIRLKKESGLLRPWTEDKILHKYKFCNIDRKNDKGTQTLLSAIDGKDLLHQLYIIFTYRIASSGLDILQRIENLSIEEIITYIYKNVNGYQKGFVVYQFTSYEKDMSVKRYLIEYVYPKLKEIEDKIKSYKYITIKEATKDILDIINFKRRLLFLIHQVTLDLSYLDNNIDIDSECEIGIGAIRGLRLIGEDLETVKAKTNLNYAQIEHSLCEYYKYAERKKGNKKRNVYNLKTKKLF